MTEEEKLMTKWVMACTSQMALSIEQLTVITGAYAKHRKDEGATDDEVEEMRAAFCQALMCRVIDLAARVAFGVRAAETSGDLIGHFADHVMVVEREQTSTLGDFLSDLFKGIETEATHRMAKQHSEGN